MHPHKPGDRVAIVLDGAQQGGMPHRRFHGLTGTVIEKRGRALAVKVKIGDAMKTVVSRPEHLRPEGEAAERKKAQAQQRAKVVPSGE